MRRDSILLREIIEAAERIIGLTEALSADMLEADPDRRDALLWNFTVLGEAVGQLSKATRAAYPKVAWDDAVRVRNRIVHGYWSIDFDVLVSTAREDIPVLLVGVRTIEVPSEEADR